MSFFRSKLGWSLVGIYLLIILYAIIEFNRTPPEPMKEFGFLILTLPGSFILSAIIERTGLIDEHNAPSWFPLLVAFGALVNITILYLVGYLISKLIRLFTPNSNRLH